MDINPPLCDSAELVELLKLGDIEVLDRVTRCYGTRLMSATRRYCRTEEEARDAVQDAAMGAWKYGEGFRGEGKVDRWLVRLVASACSRMRRGMKNDPALHISDDELIAGDDDPERIARRAELAEALTEALQELDPREGMAPTLGV